MMPAAFIPFSQLMTTPRAAQHPIALSQNKTSSSNDAPLDCLTWKSFEQHVKQLTQQLKQQSELRWAICCEDSYYFAVALMAVCHSGKQPIIPGNLQPAALTELAQQFDAVLYDAAIDVADLPLNCKLPLPLGLEVTSCQGLEATNPDVDFTVLSDLTVTLFTSGSSGQPKAIEKPLAILEREVAQLNATWGEQLHGALIASTVSHQHIYGLLFRILWPLSAGRAFLRHDWQYPEQIVQHADRDTVLITSPALLKRLQDFACQTPYRAIFSSGGPLAFEAAQHSFQLFNCYPNEVLGSTETGGIAHRQQRSPQQPWQAFVGTKIALNPEHCLRILSPLIPQDQSDGHHWYQTADQCELIDEQHFVLKGRADRVIKIEEKRISLTEIEKRLSQLDEIADVAVVPFQDNNRLITAAAITLTAQGESVLEKLGKGRFVLMLRQALHQWIEPVGIPRRFRILDEIPLNTQGKRLISDIERLFHRQESE